MAPGVRPLPGEDRPTSPENRLITWVPWLIAASALVLVAYFDLQTDLPILDEWARQWTLSRLAAGHGFQLWGSNPGLVQMAVAAPLALAHTAPRVWRLTGIPFLAMAAWYTAASCRRMGANRFWAGVGGVLIVCFPITLSIATGIMNETVFLGLFAGAMYYALRWVEDDRSQLPALVFTVLSVLQRQQGAIILVGVAVALVWRAGRLQRRSDVAWLAALALGTLVAFRGPAYMHGPAGLGGDPPGIPPLTVIRGVIGLPVLLGFLFLPLLWALTRRPKDERRGLGVATTLLGTYALLTLGLNVLLLVGGSIFPGDAFTDAGLGHLTIMGKPRFWPLALFIPVEILVLACGAVILLRRRGHWSRSTMTPARGMLILFAGGQFLAVLLHGHLDDRYYLMVALPLVPVIVGMIGTTAGDTRTGAYWAVGGLAVGVLIFAAGQQDYMSWLVARDQAAVLAYKKYPVYQVNAGFEEIAVRLWEPAADDPSGQAPRSVAPHPRAVLVFAGPADPRPGISYWSLRPGRVVIRVCPPAPVEPPVTSGSVLAPQFRGCSADDSQGR